MNDTRKRVIDQRAVGGLVEGRGVRAVCLAAAVFATFVVNAAEPAAKDKAAYSAVTQWLALWDAGRLEEALDARSELMRSKTPRDKAVAAARHHREQVGKVERRDLVEFKPLGGDSRTLQANFASMYSKAGAQCERVSVYREDDGAWRVHTWGLQPKKPEKSCSLPNL